MANRRPLPSPGHCRRSLDHEGPMPMTTSALRKETSSPAVVQQADFSLVRTIVSASGQGAAALLKAPSSQSGVWRTRSVRNKTESYCILQLKQPARGITVQITFTSSATTAREIRLLHAVAVNGSFKPLATQHTTTADAEQLQHTLTVSPNVQVQRYLKVEMQGQAVSGLTGACHAVRQLDVVQLSAIAAASAAQATQLPVPALDSPSASAIDAPGGAPLPSPAAAEMNTLEPSLQQPTAQAPEQQQQQPALGQAVSAAGAADEGRFNNWFSQTRSSLQNSRRASDSFSRAAPASTDDSRHQHLGQQNGLQQHQHQHHQPAAAQCQVDLQTTLESNRQQLQQLQEQYNLHRGSLHQQQQQHPQLLQPNGAHRQIATVPRSHAPGHAAAAVLTAAGRPSTVLSMLQRSDSWSAEQDDGSSSMDSVLLGESCMTQEEQAAAAADADVSSALQPSAAAEHVDVGPMADAVRPQQYSPPSMFCDESAVLVGSINNGPAFSSGSTRSPFEQVVDSVDPTAAQRCRSSCSVVWPAEQHATAMNANGELQLDDTSSFVAESVGDSGFGELQESIEQLPDHAQGSEQNILQGPVLVDSQSCIPSSSTSRQHREAEQQGGSSPLSDRKVQSCPVINPLLGSSNGSSCETPPLQRGLSPGCRRRAGHSSRPQQQSKSPQGPHGVLGPGSGVTLSPEIMRRGQLVKQSCPAFSFPRYNSHSPAKRSREGLLAPSAAAEAAAETGSDNDLAADAAPRRSRLSLASTSRDWQQQHQPVRDLFATQTEEVSEDVLLEADASPAHAADSVADSREWHQQQQQVANVAADAAQHSGQGSMQQDAQPAARATSHSHASSADDLVTGGEAATAEAAHSSAGADPLASPVYDCQHHASSSHLGGEQQPELESMDEFAASPVSVTGAEALAAAALAAQPAAQVQEPNQHALLQALLFSSLEFSSSVDAGQALVVQQMQPTARSPSPAGYSSPDKLQHQTFLYPQQEECQETIAAAPAVVDTSSSPVTAAPLLPQITQAVIPQLTHAVGGVILSPIAESPDVTRGLASPGGAMDPASAESDSKTKSRLPGTLLQELQQNHQVHQQVGQVSCSPPKHSSPQSWACTQQEQLEPHPERAQGMHSSAAHEQGLHPSQRHPQQQQWQLEQGQPAQDLQAEPPAVQQSRFDHPACSSGRVSEALGIVSQKPAADKATAAAATAHFSKAANKAGGPIAGYHRISSSKQRHSSSNPGATGRKQTSGATAAEAKALAGSLTARSTDFQLRTSAQQQQPHYEQQQRRVSVGTHRASCTSTSSSLSQAAKPRGSAASHKGLSSKAAGVATSRRHSTGNLLTSSTQLNSIPVRTSHLRLDLGQLDDETQRSGGGSSSSAAGASAGSTAAASGRAKSASKYEQLLKCQYGKAPAARASTAGSSKPVASANQRQAIVSDGPVTTTLSLADLVAGDGGEPACQPAAAAAPAAIAAVAAPSSAGSDAAKQQVDSIIASSQQWRSSFEPPAQLPFVQHAAYSAYDGQLQQVQNSHSQQEMHRQQQPAQRQISSNEPKQQPGGAAGTSPTSPDVQLNLFLPKLVQPQIITPKTAEQPIRHSDRAIPYIELGQNASIVQRGPSPSTPLWLGMVSPKSATKQQQQAADQLGQHLSQQPHNDSHLWQRVGQQQQAQRKEAQVRPNLGHVQAAPADQDELVRSIDEAIEAASVSLGIPSRGSSVNSAASAPQQRLAQSAQHGDGNTDCEDEVSSPPPAEPDADMAHASVAAATAGVAAAGADSGSPAERHQRPLARSCPLIASPIRASQVGRRGPAVAGCYTLQTVGQIAADAAGSSSTPDVSRPTATNAAALVGNHRSSRASSTPGSSTVVVSIVKHGRKGQQEQVQLQQRYEFEAQPIQDVVQLDVPAEVDSCASCSSSIAAADGFDSIEAQLYQSQAAVAGGSPTGTEVSMAALDAQKAAANRHRLATAAADEEEVASSDAPGAGAAAEPSVGSAATSNASSPGSCSSAVGGRRQPMHLQKPGQLKSRLGLQQLAAANSAAAAAAAEGPAPADSASSSPDLQEDHSRQSPANQHPAAEQGHGTADIQGAAGAALTRSNTGSPDSFCTASSQMGTVWPHGPQHRRATADGSANGSATSVSSSTSSVSDTGLHQGADVAAVDAVHQVPLHLQRQQQHQDAAVLAAEPADGEDNAGVHLAREFYQKSGSQHTCQSSAAANSRHSVEQGKRGDAASSVSSAGMHSLWDETDPAVESASSPASPTAQAGAGVRSSQQQQQDAIPHRFSFATTKQAAITVAGRHSTDAAAGQQSATHVRTSRDVRGSIYRSLDGSVLSDVSVISEADSASSAAGPPKQLAVVALADGGQAAALPNAAQQSGQQSSASPEQAASTSLSFAAMRQAQPDYSSPHSTPGISSTAAASRAAVKSQSAATAAVDVTPTGPASLAAAVQQPLDASQEGSVGSSGSPVHAGPSVNDLGLDESSKTAGSKKDQSPNKQAARGQSPDKQPAGKPTAAAAGPGGLGASPNSSASKLARAVRPTTPVADQDQYVDAEDLRSISSQGSLCRGPTVAGHRTTHLESQQQQQQQLSPYSPLQQNQQQTGPRSKQQPQLQVVVPGSPQMARTLASSAVCFSPLHAGRSSRASCGSMGHVVNTPGKVTTTAPSTQGAVSCTSGVQPAFSSESVAAVPAAEGSASAAAPSATAASGNARQQSAAGAGPYTGFSPLHSMMPGSGSGGRVSSKTHSRTKQGSGAQEDEVSMVRKNLMDDMLRAAAAGVDVTSILGYVGTATDDGQLLDTHEVRDSKQVPAASLRAGAYDQQAAILHTPLRPHKGSVLDKVNLQLPTVGVSPAPQQLQQQPSSLAGSSSFASAQQSQHTLSESSQSQLHQEPSIAYTVSENMLQQGSSGLLPQGSTRFNSGSGMCDSLQLMSQSSAAAAAALRAAAATPAPIPYHSSPVAEGSAVDDDELQNMQDPQQQQQQQHRKPSAAEGHKGSSAGSSLAVVSVDGAIPPIAATPAQRSILGQGPPAAASRAVSGATAGSKQQASAGLQLPAVALGAPAISAAAAPGSEGKVTNTGAGPLSSGLLRRYNSAGSIPRMTLAIGMPAVNAAAMLSPVAGTDTAAAVEAQAGEVIASDGSRPSDSRVTSPVAGGHDAAAELTVQQQQPVAPAATKVAASPYLQQLEEHRAHAAQQLQHQQRAVTASPLSSHRHNLHLRAVPVQPQRAQSPAATATGTAGQLPTAAAASPVPVRPASSLGHVPATPSGSRYSGSSHTAGDAVGTPAAFTAGGKDLAAVSRGVSCGGRVSPTPDGNGGAARMGRLRHRRARSDMPEYYPISPLESPLHTAMPEDSINMCEITLSPQVSAAAMAALAAAEAAAAATPGAAAVGRLAVPQVPAEPPASPLGSPLRHGLTSPAAMYRIQQQQLREQASQQQMGPEQSAATAAARSPGPSPAVSPEASKAEVQQKQAGVAQAVADAVAAYEGSISPGRLAKIQEYVTGLVSMDFGGSILDQHTPQAKSVRDVILAATPGKESDAFDSFNLNNQHNLQAELEEHGQQLQQQQLAEQQGNSSDVRQQQHVELQPSQQQQMQEEIHAEQLDEQHNQQLNAQQQQQQEGPSKQSQPQDTIQHHIVADEGQHQQQEDDHLTPRQELSGILTARLSQCSSSTVRASVEALLASKLRSSTSSRGSGGAPSVAEAAAGEGECAAAVAQLLQANHQQQAAASAGSLELQQEVSGRLRSSRSHHSSSAGSEHVDQQQQQQRQEGAPLTSARLRQHSIASSSSYHSSNQRYPLNAETSYASSAAAAPAAEKSLLASIHELLNAPTPISVSTDSMSLQPSKQPSTGQVGWSAATAEGLGYRLSQDSQQEAVMQSHGALLGPGPNELSTAAGGAVKDTDRPAALAAKPAAGPPGPAALAGGMFRRSAQLLAGLAQGLWQPMDVGSVESTAGSMAVGSKALGSRAAGGLRTSQGFDPVLDDADFGNQLRASVNLVAGSLDISGPQVVRLTQQLWLNRLVPGAVPEEGLSDPTAATAGSTQRSGVTASAATRSGHDQGAGLQQRQQHRQLQQLGKPHGAAAQVQQQMGPLLAGRLAAMAAMRQLRRSSVGESPDVITDSLNLAGSRRLGSALAAAGRQPLHPGNTAAVPIAEGSGTNVGIAASVMTVRGSYTAAGPVTGGGIGRGRLSAAEASVPGALTTSSSFSSGGVPGFQPVEGLQDQGPLARQLSAQRRQQQQQQQQVARSNAVRASVTSVISNEDGFYDQDEVHDANNNLYGVDACDYVDDGGGAAAAAMGFEDSAGPESQAVNAQASELLHQLLWGEDSSNGSR